MKRAMGIKAKKFAHFCLQPWRLAGMAVAALIASTFVWAIILLTTFHTDDNFAEYRDFSLTEFLLRNVGQPGSPSLPDAVIPAVVGIGNGSINGDILGSGTIVGANGYVLTTLHTVATLDQITVRVRTTTGFQTFAAQVVKKLPLHDLVMLKIQSGGHFLYLSLADIKPGLSAQLVSAFGQGTGGAPIVRQGRILDKPVQISVGATTISHLRPTNAVYSWEQNGGPVVSDNGAVVGIAMAITDPTGATRGFIVPSDVINAHFLDVLPFKLVPLPVPRPAVTTNAVTGPVVMPGRPLEVALPQVMQPRGVPLSIFGPQAPAGSGQPATGATAWWQRAAGAQSGATNAIGAANGPPAAQPKVWQPPALDQEHLLGQRIAGFTIKELLGLSLLAVIKGVIGGMMTMGGGVFLVAGMMMFFGYGMFLIRPVAYLTNLVVYSASTMSHNKNGLITWDKVKALAPWAMLGVVAGYFIGNSIGDRLVEILLGICAVLMAIKAGHELLSDQPDEILLADKANGRAKPRRPRAADGLDDDELGITADKATSSQELGKAALLGLPMGVLSGILGITGGVVEVPLQHYVGKIPLKNAIANSAVLVLCASMTGTVVAFTHGIAVGLIDWQTPLSLAAVLIPASFVGGILGAHLTKLMPKQALKAIFAVLMLAVAVKMFIGAT